MSRRRVFAALFVLSAVIWSFGFGCGSGPDEPSDSRPAPTVEKGKRPQPVTGPVLLTAAPDEWNVTFTHDAGAAGELAFPEMMGGGVAIFDADGDADLDLYFVSGAPDLGRSPDPAVVNRLFVNDGNARFVDATAASGLGDPGYGTGVAIGDIDNDGNEDVFVANVGPDRLFLGQGGGRFVDASDSSGIAATGEDWDDWSSSAVFCDVDRDGFLDLYVVRYVVYDPSVECSDKAGRREYCGPASFEDRTDVLLLNQQDGSFRDVSEQAGIQAVTGAGLGVVCEDLDDDGWPDIYVANDGDPNQLWRNQGDGTFIDDALILGTSVNAAGLYEAGMGVVAADLDNDLDADLFLTHLRDETNTLYRNLGNGIGFEDATTQAGLAAASTPYTGFGTAPLDLDLDGDLDLAIANGRVKQAPALTTALDAAWNPYAEPNLVYLNRGGSFVLATTETEAFTTPIEVSRGLAVGDLDGDGDLDLVLSNLGSPSRLYSGQAPPRHWLLVDAVDPRLKRRALGARVTVHAAGRQQMRSVQGAMSYLSSSDPRAHFGLGESAAPVLLSVRWPDGLVEQFEGVKVDQVVVLRRGEGSS